MKNKEQKNKELNCVIDILKKRLASIEDNKVYICNYQCCKFNFESGYMEEMKEHMPAEH